MSEPDRTKAAIGARAPLRWTRAVSDPPRWVQVLDGQVVAELGLDDVADELNALVAAATRRG